MTDLAVFLNDAFAFTDYEDAFFVADDQVFVSDNNIRAAGMITHKLNNSKLFDTQLVKLGKRGDCIMLGFDTMADAESVYTDEIGPEATEVEVKRDANNRCLLYVDGHRYTRTFPSLAAAKRYIEQLDQQLNHQPEVEADEVYEYEE